MRTNQLTRLASLLEVLAFLSCSSDDSSETVRNPAVTPDAALEDAALDDAALADAGPPSPPPDLGAAWREHPMFQSGSRLRARVWDGGGAAIALAGFRDVELARDCVFAVAEDGEHRCLPASNGSIYYLDPDCTQAVYHRNDVASCSQGLAPYATETFAEPGQCGGSARHRVFRVSALRANAFAYAASGGGCNAVGTLECLRDAERVDPSAFVRAEVVSEPAGEAFAVERLRAEDGASTIRALRDQRHDVECSVQPEIRNNTCLPLPAAQVVGEVARNARGIYSDATCSASRAVLDQPRDACAPASMVVLQMQTVCGTYEPKAYELGAARATGFSDTGSGCRAFAVSAGQKLYEVGSELDLGSRPAVQLANGAGDRVLLRYYATPSGLPVQYESPPFYDGQLLARCAPQPMADGRTRCVPAGAVPLDERGPFADAGCTERLLTVPNPNLPNACGLAPEFAQRSENGELAAVHSLTRVSGALETVFFRDGGACTGRRPRPGWRYYRVGGQLELAELRARVE